MNDKMRINMNILVRWMKHLNGMQEMEVIQTGLQGSITLLLEGIETDCRYMFYSAN